MKTKTCFLLLILNVLVLQLNAGNLQISNTSIVKQDVSSGENHPNNHKFIQFDVEWCNSWRTSDKESNWDAVWLFVKYRKLADPDWNHAILANAGHTQPAGSTITSSGDGTGVFIYRDGDGIGDVAFPEVELRWNYIENGLADYDSVEICVFGIEMVYIPQGSFYLGSSGVETGTFTDGSWAGVHTVDPSIPFQITSEAAVPIGNNPGHLWGTGGTGAINRSFWHAGAPTPGSEIPAAYPKGFASFYIMKYMITQGQWVAFLNKLTRAQQNARTNTALGPAVTSTANVFVMSNTASPNNRNGIACASNFDANIPITFFNDLNSNGVSNESTDGEHLAMNYLSWNDLMAYADWTGLRPYSEFEYEKASRGGTLIPIADQYAWGNTNITGSTGLINSGAENEFSSNAANVTFNNHAGIQGPTRVGMYARPATTSRQEAGATYYGILDMSGNQREQVLNMCHAQGYNFTGTHGNGSISVTGEADEVGWPNYRACALRGGAYNTTSLELRVSDRSLANWRNNNNDNGRYASMGGRLARTAP